MEIKYTRQGDYLIPNLYLENDETIGRIGKYGILRLHFIAQNKQALYEALLMTNKLTKKKTPLDPDNDFKKYTIEIQKKKDYEDDKRQIIIKNKQKLD